MPTPIEQPMEEAAFLRIHSYYQTANDFIQDTTMPEVSFIKLLKILSQFPCIAL